MDIEEIREYCLSLPMTSEDMAFGEEYLLFRVCGKIFACYGFVRLDYFVLKANSDYALELCDRYIEIEPAWHWNKRYWIQLNLHGTISTRTIKSLIRHSYSQVVRKLPKAIRNKHPEICEVSE